MNSLISNFLPFVVEVKVDSPTCILYPKTLLVFGVGLENSTSIVLNIRNKKFLVL